MRSFVWGLILSAGAALTGYLAVEMYFAARTCQAEGGCPAYVGLTIVVVATTVGLCAAAMVALVRSGRQRYSSRSGEGPGELGEDGQVGVKPYPVQSSDA
jgi:hypothetical protein